MVVEAPKASTLQGTEFFSQPPLTAPRLFPPPPSPPHFPRGPAGLEISLIQIYVFLYFSLRFHPARASIVCLPPSSLAGGLGNAPIVPSGLSREWGPGAPRLRVLQLGFVSQGDPPSRREELGLKASLLCFLAPSLAAVDTAGLGGCFHTCFGDRNRQKRGDPVLRRA